MTRLPLRTFCALSFFLIPPAANAADGYLFISPQRLQLDDKTKTGQLHLVNKSDEQKTYEIIVKEYRMDASGNLKEGSDADGVSAKPFLRYSPRRITLAAGEDQYVRVMSKFTPETADGSYHSHLEFSEVEGLQAKTPEKNKGAKNSVSFSVGAAYGIAIPVLLNKGDAMAVVKLVSLKPKVTAGSRTGTAELTLTREGDASSYHLFTFTYIDPAGKEHLAATPARIPVYREVGTITREFPLNLPEGVTFGGGRLKLVLTTIADGVPTEQIANEIQAKIN